MSKKVLIAILAAILLAIASPFVGIALYRDAHSVKSDLMHYYVIHTKIEVNYREYAINHVVQYYELYKYESEWSDDLYTVVITVGGKRIEFDPYINPARIYEMSGAYDCVSYTNQYTGEYKEWC